MESLSLSLHVVAGILFLGPAAVVAVVLTAAGGLLIPRITPRRREVLSA